jgi:hypothetical protein
MVPLAMVFGAAAVGCVVQPVVPLETGPDESVANAEAVIERQLTINPDDGPPPSEGGRAPMQRPLDPLPFAIGAGYGALSHVDVAGCRERGLPSGYVRLHATFTRDGYITHASVTSPTAPPASALDCIADQLRLAGVPAFDGHDARLSKTYFVQPATAGAIGQPASPTEANESAPAGP